MKLYIKVAAILALVLLAGCSEPIDITQLQERNGIYYQVNDPDPYSGKVVSFHENGQKLGEVNYVDGKLQGKFIGWYENGQKSVDVGYADGKEQGKFIGWYEDGQKSVEVNYVNGKLQGKVILWHEDGQLKSAVNYSDGVRK